MHPTLFLPAGFQLAVTVLLVVVPVIFATPSSSRPSPRGVHLREVDPENILPWVDQGCYTDNQNQRTLTSIMKMAQDMSVGLCLNTCYDNYLHFAGLENGDECFCGNVTTDGSTYASPSLCNVDCAGDLRDPSENCGGVSSLRLFRDGTPPQGPPVFGHHEGPWGFIGCYHDDDNQRTLTVPQSVIGGEYNNTVDNCIEACEGAGYSMAGMRSALYCWCDNHINQGRTPIDESSCMLPCPGDNLEICGGPDSLTIYSLPKNAPP